MHAAHIYFIFACTGLRERLVEAWPSRCAVLVLELLETERRYVQSLEEILKVFSAITKTHSNDIVGSKS